MDCASRSKSFALLALLFVSLLVGQASASNDHHGISNNGGTILGLCFCGDSNADDIITISDAVHVINFIFGQGPSPNPMCQGDADGNGIVSISDAVCVINYIFASGPMPHCPPPK